MAVIRKLNAGIIEKKVAYEVVDGIQRETRTFEGPYTSLQAKAAGEWRQWKSSILTPNGPNATLVQSRETPAPDDWEMTGSETVIEVIWQELRQEPSLHPAFKDMSESQRVAIKNAVDEGGDKSGTFGTALENKLYELMKLGINPVTGVPVVRRTITRKNASAARAAAGQAWIRQDPPISVAGTWEWLKTADERRKDGRTYTQIEEWTGATQWDPVLYP